MKRFIYKLPYGEIRTSKTQESHKMATLLQRMTAGSDAREGDVRPVKLVGDKGISQDFDLVGKLRDGSLVFAGSHHIFVPASERPWVEKEAEVRALGLAQQMGFDYALVEGAGSDLHRGNNYLAQFYLESKR